MGARGCKSDPVYQGVYRCGHQVGVEEGEERKEGRVEECRDGEE